MAEDAEAILRQVVVCDGHGWFTIYDLSDGSSMVTIDGSIVVTSEQAAYLRRLQDEEGAKILARRAAKARAD
jgi:hypothetical protein